MIVIMENLGPRAKQLDHVHDGKLQGPMLNPESVKVRVCDRGRFKEEDD
jgi:hypothetical protein